MPQRTRLFKSSALNAQPRLRGVVPHASPQAPMGGFRFHQISRTRTEPGQVHSPIALNRAQVAHSQVVCSTAQYAAKRMYCALYIMVLRPVGQHNSYMVDVSSVIFQSAPGGTRGSTLWFIVSLSERVRDLV